MRSTGGFTMDSLQLRAANAGQGHGDETHRFRARGEEWPHSTYRCLRRLEMKLYI